MMAGTREPLPPRLKRQYDEVALSGHDLSKIQPSKRSKIMKLHRRTLKELDRYNNSRRSASTFQVQHVYRASDLEEIQNYARHGGPDLSDVRGVHLI